MSNKINLNGACDVGGYVVGEKVVTSTELWPLEDGQGYEIGQVIDISDEYGVVAEFEITELRGSTIFGVIVKVYERTEK